jgi:hypothetical protein
VAKRTLKERRAIIVGLGTVAAAGALGGRSAQAQESSDSFTPLMHQQDAWMSALRGKHRIVMDVTAPDGLPDAIRFTGNLLAGHKSWWGVEEADVAIIVCLRHGATPFGYTDAIWSKYGKTIDAISGGEPLQLGRTIRARRSRQAGRPVHGLRHRQPGARGSYRRVRR